MTKQEECIAACVPAMGYYLIYDEESGKSLYVWATSLNHAIERGVCIDYARYNDGDYVPRGGE